MSDDLVKVYDAIHFAEAEMIRQALEEEGINAFVEKTPSPLDGLTAMGQGTPIMVREEDSARAEQIIEQFLEQRADEEE